MIEMKDIEEKLKINGYKLTPQRRVILEVLVKNKGHFISVERIYSKICKNNPKINISTIYRNLEILVDLNIIHKIYGEEGCSQYGVICTHSHHHHIICKNCGKTEVIDYCPINDFKNIIEDKNFELTDHKLELYGYCQNCKNEPDK